MTSSRTQSPLHITENYYHVLHKLSKFNNVIKDEFTFNFLKNVKRYRCPTFEIHHVGFLFELAICKYENLDDQLNTLHKYFIVKNEKNISRTILTTIEEMQLEEKYPEWFI